MSGYVGRCDICGRNLYDYDDTVTVMTSFARMTVCRYCCVANRRGVEYDIVDLLDAMAEKEAADDAV